MWGVLVFVRKGGQQGETEATARGEYGGGGSTENAWFSCLRDWKQTTVRVGSFQNCIDEMNAAAKLPQTTATQGKHSCRHLQRADHHVSSKDDFCQSKHFPPKTAAVQTAAVQTAAVPGAEWTSAGTLEGSSWF